MNSLSTTLPEAERVSIEKPDSLTVKLKDERSITVPLSWFPRLQNATPEQRRNFVLIGEGIHIYWPEVDEFISVRGLLDGRKSVEAG